MTYFWQICPRCEGEGSIPVHVPYGDREQYFFEVTTTDENGEEVDGWEFCPPTYECLPCRGTGKVRVDSAHVEYPYDSDKVCGCEACRHERRESAREDARLAWREDGCPGDFSDYYIESKDYRDRAD